MNFALGYVNAQNPPYSAKGDGASDDTAAIQTALNDAGNNGGGIVLLPLGNYFIATHLTVPANTTLAGNLAGAHRVFAKQRHYPPGS